MARTAGNAVELLPDIQGVREQEPEDAWQIVGVDRKLKLAQSQKVDRGVVRLPNEFDGRSTEQSGLSGQLDDVDDG